MPPPTVNAFYKWYKGREISNAVAHSPKDTPDTIRKAQFYLNSTSFGPQALITRSWFTTCFQILNFKSTISSPEGCPEQWWNHRPWMCSQTGPLVTVMV